MKCAVISLFFLATLLLKEGAALPRFSPNDSQLKAYIMALVRLLDFIYIARDEDVYTYMCIILCIYPCRLSS